MKNSIKLSLFILVSVFIYSCKIFSETENKGITSGIFKLLEDGKTIEMDGVIKRNSYKNFNKILKTHPTITTINIKSCDGSIDDKTNLKLSKKIYDLGLHIHLNDNGLIASGGVDFFLSGRKRTCGKDVQIGVHSWSNGKQEAIDFPDDHIYHQPYIQYYKSIGFTEQEAEDFYFFTIKSAPAHDIHWMTDSEIIKYKIIKT